MHDHKLSCALNRESNIMMVQLIHVSIKLLFEDKDNLQIKNLCHLDNRMENIFSIAYHPFHVQKLEVSQREFEDSL